MASSCSGSTAPRRLGISKRRLNQVSSYIELDATREEKRKLSEAFAPQKMPEQINFEKFLVDSVNVTDSDLASAPVRRSMTNSGEWELISVDLMWRNKLRDRRKTAEVVCRTIRYRSMSSKHASRHLAF